MSRFDSHFLDSHLINVVPILILSSLAILAVQLSKPEVGKKRKSREEAGTDGNTEGKIVTRAFPEMKGHTGYLTFANLKTK